MQGKALQIAIASAVFFVLNLLFFGTQDGRIYAAAASTLVFAMMYAAIIVAVRVFRRDDEG